MAGQTVMLPVIWSQSQDYQERQPRRIVKGFQGAVRKPIARGFEWHLVASFLLYTAMKIWVLVAYSLTLLPSHGLQALSGSIGCPMPTYPAFAVNSREAGTVTLDVYFNQSGSVGKCIVKKSSAPAKLTDFTVSFVKQHWKDGNFAGKSVEVPIVYRPWNDKEFPSPPLPEIAYWYHQHGIVTLNITFDSEGHVDKCLVKETTAPQSLTEYTRRFVMGNWESKENAGKTITAPITWIDYRNNP